MWKSSQCIHAVFGPRGLSHINQPPTSIIPPPPASRLGLLHYRARLTRADTHTLPQSSPGIGFLNTVQQELVLHLFFFTSLLLFILFLLPFLSFCVLTHLFFLPLWPRILRYEVILPWLTGVLGVKRVWDSFYFPYCLQGYCVCVWGGRGTRENIQTSTEEKGPAKSAN